MILTFLLIQERKLAFFFYFCRFRGYKIFGTKRNVWKFNDHLLYNSIHFLTVICMNTSSRQWRYLGRFVLLTTTRIPGYGPAGGKHKAIRTKLAPEPGIDLTGTLSSPKSQTSQLAQQGGV